MILWTELENYYKESIKKDQNLEIELLFNKCKITSFVDYSYFVYTTSLEILELQKDKYSIIDKTIESKEVKSQTRFLQVLLKKEVFE